MRLGIGIPGRGRAAGASTAGWIDVLSSAHPAGSNEFYGAYTTGVEFTALASGPCTGVRFLFGTGAGPQVVLATLWDAVTGLAVASDSVVCAPASDNVTGPAFGSHVLISGRNYRVSTYFAAGYCPQTTLPPVNVPAAFARYTVTQPYCSVLGYGYPANVTAGYGFYVEPVF